jgi:hypothetical protein
MCSFEPFRISAISRKEGQIDLFLCRTDGEVYTTSDVSSDVWQNGCEWKSIRGRFQPSTKISVVSRASEYLDLFICDEHGDVHTTWWNNVFQFEKRWEKLGDGFPANAEITVVACNEDGLDIFICGKDDRVYHRQWRMDRHPLNWLRRGAWSPWKSLNCSFPIGVRISAVTRPSEQIDLFTCDRHGFVRKSSSKSGANWSEWETIGVGFPAGAAVTAIFRNGNLHLFVCGKNGQVYTAQWTEDLGWPKPDNWTSLGGSFLPGTMVTAIFRSCKEIDLFICDYNGSVSTSWWTIGDGWSEWELIGGESPGRVEVAAVIRNPGSDFEVFVGSYDGQEYIVEMTRGAQSRWDKRWQLIWKEVWCDEE